MMPPLRFSSEQLQVMDMVVVETEDPKQLYQRLAVVLLSVQQPYKMRSNQINLIL
jgi:hypothetical protein